METPRHCQQARRRTPPSPAVTAAAAVLLTPPTLPRSHWVWAPPASQRGLKRAEPAALPPRMKHADDAMKLFGEERFPRIDITEPAPQVESELADLRDRAPSAEPARREAYGRPVDRRDLGHLCYRCRRPFNSLGMKLVVELQRGREGHRFHPECWQQHSGGQVPEIYGRIASSAGSPGDYEGHAPDVETDVVSAYADEWRRASPALRRAPRDRQAGRESVLDGLISLEDEQGGRRVARGFSHRETEAAMDRWSCTLVPEDCAICLLRMSQPVRLPCGHTFCGKCIEPWLRRCALCPMCRQDLHPSMGVELNAAQPGRSVAQADLPASPRGSCVQSPRLRGSSCENWGLHVHRLRPLSPLSARNLQGKVSECNQSRCC